MTFINFIVGGLFIVLGFSIQKYPDLIAGYNSLSDNEKKRVDVKRLSAHLKVILLIMGAMLILTSFLLAFYDISDFGIFAVFTIIPAGTFYMWWVTQKSIRKNY